VVYYLLLFIYSVNIKPSRHRFGFSLAWDWQQGSDNNTDKDRFRVKDWGLAIPSGDEYTHTVESLWGSALLKPLLSHKRIGGQKVPGEAEVSGEPAVSDW
jgi:hypothetical protein